MQNYKADAPDARFLSWKVFTTLNYIVFVRTKSYCSLTIVHHTILQLTKFVFEDDEETNLNQLYYFKIFFNSSIDPDPWLILAYICTLWNNRLPIWRHYVIIMWKLFPPNKRWFLVLNPCNMFNTLRNSNGLLLNLFKFIN